MYKILSLILVCVLLTGTFITIQAQEPLPEVVPVNNPGSLQTGFIAWNWSAFLGEDNFYNPPDPLPITLPDSYMGTLPAPPYDLSQVKFVNDAGLNQAQLDALAQNGFVVVPGNMTHFENAYHNSLEWDTETGHSFWVTTDSMLNGLHIAFDNLLKFLEMDSLNAKMTDITRSGYQAAMIQRQQLIGTPLEAEAQDVAVYYAVALGLFSPDEFAASVSDPAIQAEASQIIQMANAAEGRLEISFLPGYQEDFSQYKPRGHYSGDPILEKYFRGMMWLGRITFLAKDDATLRMGILALRPLLQSGAYADWQTVSDTLTFLIGPVDNIGPAEYLALGENIFGTGIPLENLSDAALLAQFKAEVQALPGPRIHNVVRPMGTQADELDSSTRGFRLFGQRFTFDSYAMQKLIYPEVGDVGTERILPSGLDIAAVLGSDVAYNILNTQGDTAYLNYVENMAGLRNEVNQISPLNWLESIYGGWLWTLQPLWNRQAASYPPLFSTDAWLKRDLHAGLSSYTELKHDTLLYTVEPMGGLGGGGELIPTTYSYVEPNPLVFSRIAIVAASVYQGIQQQGVASLSEPGMMPSNITLVLRAFYNHAELAAMLAEMARKLVWGEALTEEEQLFLKYNYAGKLFHTRYAAELMILADPPKNVALVADVASNPDAGLVLQLATGNVDYIYVITDSPDGLQLTRGSVYSYYEFVNNIDNRLNDDEWRETVIQGQVPPRPDWVNAFFIP